jgi:uncharacterized protein
MSDSSLRIKIQEDMKAAMRAHDTARLTAIRLLLAAIKQKEIDERITLDDIQIFAVIEKMQKQLRDAITQFQSAQRLDLVAKETLQLEVLQTYLPKPLTESEVLQLIKNAIVTTQAISIKDMSKVIAALKPTVQGRADFAVVSTIIKDLLSNT